MFNLSRPLAPELEDFYFQADDRELVDGCVTALTRDGLNVAILAAHPAALEHYGNLLVARLRKFTPTSKVEVYFPTSSDDLLGRFNQALANQSLAQAMQGRKNILATQFWVLNNASAVPDHELQLLASLVHNFPGANIRLILFFDTSRQANPSLSAFGKNITRWEIALPGPAQRAQLIAQAQGSAQQKAVRAFLNRLNNEEAPSSEPTLVKKRFRNPFARRGRSMAQAAPRIGARPWMPALRWTVAIVALLAASAGFLYWLNPGAFQFWPTTAPAATTPDAKAASNAVQGKTTDGKKVSKTADPKAVDAKASDTQATDSKTGDSGKPIAAKADAAPSKTTELLDELPNEAAAGQAWAKNLPADGYVVQHVSMPVFKNVVAWQQANPKLAQAHIVAVYKPGDKLAQFALISGPFKSRSAAVEFTLQPQTPRLALAMPSNQLMQRLSPREVAPSAKPKEIRR